MKLHTLSPAQGANTSDRRLGRGIGSGLGKTSGKGGKGQWGRSGGGVRVGFEGGTMPLTRRIPKRGFKNVKYMKVYSVVNIGTLNDLFDNGAVVNAEVLYNMGVISQIEEYGLKVLGNGELKKNLTVQAKKFSESAAKKITEAGGKVEVL
jgi:large subunit ribosomal protein L15